MGGIVTKGDFSYGDPIVRGDISNVHVGKYTSIAQNVIVDCGWGHNYNFVSTFPFNAVFKERFGHIKTHPVSKGDIHIGNDVWVGENVVIMSGVTIADGSVIGTNSVVTKSTRPYSISAGSPAKEIKLRFKPYLISRLLLLKWWDLPHEEAQELVPLLMSENIEELLKKYNL